MFLNIFGNVLAFMPFGFFLPVIWVRTRHWYITVLLSFAMSLLVETMQLVGKVGSFDVDDLILNTLGGVIGYLLFWICNKIRRRYMAKKRMYSFTKEKHSGKGILSTILGTLSLVILPSGWLAYYLDGQGGVYLGSIGLLGMVFAVSSVGVRTDGIGEKQCALPVSEDWSILGGIMVALWVFVVLIGI